MIKALVDLIDQHKQEHMTICEIGCWIGDTTKHYLPIIESVDGKVIIIDWFLGCADIQQEHPHKFNPENRDIIFQTFINNIGGCKDYMTIYQADSKECAHLITDNSIDICFIDGDHLYHNVKKDIELYLPKVKSGGILCGHDMENIDLANTFSEEELRSHYARECHPGVIQAVYDAFGNNIETIADPNGDLIPIWVYRKL